MNFIIRLLVTAAVAYLLSMILSGVHIAGFQTAIIFALVLAILNFIVRPLLVLLTLPITIITLGIFLFIINALIIMLADRFIDGIKVDGFLWALIFSLVLSFVSAIVNKLLEKK